MIHARFFGKTSEGKDVYALTLKDGKNEAVILNLGGIIQSLKIADKNGNLVDVVLGYNDVAGYENNGGYLGALIGRFGNRIEKGRLVIDGERTSFSATTAATICTAGRKGSTKKFGITCLKVLTETRSL